MRLSKLVRVLVAFAALVSAVIPAESFAEGGPMMAPPPGAAPAPGGFPGAFAGGHALPGAPMGPGGGVAYSSYHYRARYSYRQGGCGHHQSHGRCSMGMRCQHRQQRCCRVRVRCYSQCGGGGGCGGGRLSVRVSVNIRIGGGGRRGGCFGRRMRC